MTEADAYALILQRLGELRDDLANDREASHESRQRTHERIDELVKQVGKLETTVAVAGKVEAQLRDQVAKLERRVARVEPAAEEWRRMQRLGMSIVGLLGLGGVSLGAIAVWGGNMLVDWVRHWLRLQ